MRDLTDIRGLKYPDEFVVRHFFKRGLQGKAGHVLELGSGTGNNLSLYAQYGWRMTGVDFDPDAIDACRWNLGDGPSLITADLSAGLPQAVQGPFDALILPNLLCYLTAAQVDGLFPQLKAQLAPGAEVFVRTRLIDDYRYGRGRRTEADGFVLATPETGEDGLFNRFYTEHGLVSLLTDAFALSEVTSLRVRFDNVQAGRSVPGNSDLVVWGRAA